MRRTERKKIETVKSGNQIFGHIKLNNLANPESIRITINGDKIKPTSYDIYGSPEFPKELVEYYNWKEQEIRIKNGKKDFILKAEVSYEERPFDIPTECFDSKEGIKKSLNSLKDFTEMLNNRLIFHTISGNALNEFIIFGKYLLSSDGQFLLRNYSFGSSVVFPNIMENSKFEHLLNSFKKTDSIYSKKFPFPQFGDFCPCCGRKFSIDDVKNSSFEFLNKKVTHKNCFENFTTLEQFIKEIK